MEPLRSLLARALDWGDAHIDFDSAVAGIPQALRGVRPDGLPHSAWELLEHMRLTQADILDFCVSPAYEERQWPDDYWPGSREPESEGGWGESVAAFRVDRESLKQLAQRPDIDLFAAVPQGGEQTYFRELLLVVDHTSYHVGQLVLVRRALGIWPTR